MEIIAIISNLLIIIGCFLPWIQMGPIFANCGMDGSDGKVMLISSTASLIATVYFLNIKQKRKRAKVHYLIVGGIGLIFVLYNMSDANNKAHRIIEDVSALRPLLDNAHEDLNLNMVGTGLYFAGMGSIGLLLCSLGIFKSVVNEQPGVDEAPDAPVLHKYVKKDERTEEETEEDEDTKYFNALVALNKAIKAQKHKVFGGGMTEDILSQIDALCGTQDEAIHLLNSYQELFKTDLVQDIKSLNSSYEATRRNLATFIDLDILKAEYPHDPK